MGCLPGTESVQVPMAGTAGEEPGSGENRPRPGGGVGGGPL